jgi:NADPH2:quinone reductase
MLAAYYTRQGPARDVLQFGEQPTPELGGGEVLVRLRTSGVNPSDWKVRRGGFNRPLIGPLIIPHSDGAGDIEAIGRNVSQSRIGERVWIWNGQWKRPFGTAAQFISIASEQAVRLPPHIDYSAGACLGIPALTAVQAVRLARLTPGSTVLISGGAGAVAHYAIQIAKVRGARVFTTVSGDTKATHARAAGADEIINYRTENVADRIRLLTDGVGVDAVIEVDLTANAKLLPAILRQHGIIVVYGLNSPEVAVPALWMLQNSTALRFFLVYELSAQDRVESLAELNRLLENDHLIHAVGRRLPLDDVIEAHECLERGDIIGNMILDVT